jgi:hypothetical protein
MIRSIWCSFKKDKRQGSESRIQEPEPDAESEFGIQIAPKNLAHLRPLCDR